MGALPPILLAAFAAWWGTLPGASGWSAMAAGAFALVVLSATLGGGSDPLRLGPSGRWLVAAFGVAFLGSLAASPTPRSGWVAAALLPAYLWLPSAVARAWHARRRRDLGLALWALALLAIAGWALVERALHGGHRTAMPLGHHNLLAVWLVTSIPLAGAAAARSGWTRWIGWAAIGVGAAALVETRSLAGALGALAALGVVFGFRGRAAHLALGLALLGAAFAMPRIDGIVAGRDPSAAARFGYVQAGWRGFLARPLLGWGPGSTPWTIAEWMRPRPGVHPPSELVGDLHSQPMQMLYELGAPTTALAIAIGMLFWARALGARRRAVDRPLLEGAIAGLTGGGVALLASAPQAVPALAVAFAAVAGAALAGIGDPQPSEPPSARRLRLAVGLVALTLLAPVVLAARSYELARAARGADRNARLSRAVALDPFFPLYRARLARPDVAPTAAAAEEVRRAAEDAPGVAAFWLRAGVVGRATGAPWAEGALARALALDPLAAMPAYQLGLARRARKADDGLDCLARAVAAEPRLAAATLWRSRPGDLLAISRRLARWPGLDPGWREATSKGLAELAAELPGRRPAQLVDLGATMDASVELGLSLHLFHRRTWKEDLARVALDRDLVRYLRVPSASSRPESDLAAFPRDRCAP